MQVNGGQQVLIQKNSIPPHCCHSGVHWQRERKENGNKQKNDNKFNDLAII